MKKFLITLSISIVLVLGIWIIPAITTFKYKKDYSVVAEEPYEMMEQDTVSLDTVARNFIQLQYPDLQEEIVSASTPALDWQALITWIIGSLNGVFGLIIMIKKVFAKTKS